MKKTATLTRLICAILLTVCLLSVTACGDTATVFVSLDGNTKEVEITLSDYGDAPTLYDVLYANEELEADLDKTTDPYTIMALCNVRADATQVYRVYSNDADDAEAGAAAISFEGEDYYPVTGNVMQLVLRGGTSYLLRLEVLA